MDSQTRADAMIDGSWEMEVQRNDQAFALPFTNVTNLAPITANFRWHVEGDQPRQLMDFEQELIDIVEEYRSTFDAAERRALMFNYNQIFTENVYDLGIFIGRYGLGTNQRFNNIADGTPVFLYTWVEDAILLDTVWSAVEDQLPQNRPETLADYGGE